jgi:long-subunit fatty acid transport protein
MGNVDLTGNDGSSIGNYKPNEFAMDFTLAKKFGETFSLATTARYIHSSSGNGVAFSNAQAANAFAADVSATIKNKTILFQKEAELSYGLNISNIGTKVSYSKDGPKYFLPTNLKLGVASAFKLDEKDEFTLALDLNKLLVPAGQQSTDAFGNTFYDTSNISVPSGIFKSFGNPGAFKEITYSLGAEYKYDQMFAIRAGYFYENPDNGNRQYFTAGAGFRYKQLDFDFAYLFASQQASPLANTLRFSIAYSFSQK